MRNPSYPVVTDAMGFAALNPSYKDEPPQQAQLLAEAVLSRAARRPLASLIASSFAQKCMK